MPHHEIAVQSGIEEKMSYSNCFACGKKEHWKQECPEKVDYESDGDMSMITVENTMNEKFYG